MTLKDETSRPDTLENPSPELTPPPIEPALEDNPVCSADTTPPSTGSSSTGVDVRDDARVPSAAPPAVDATQLAQKKKLSCKLKAICWAKIAFLGVVLSSAVVYGLLLNWGHTTFAWGYLLLAGSPILIAAGLLFKQEKAQAVIAILGLALVCISWWKFNPVDLLPHDPEIAHTLTPIGGKASLMNGDLCLWSYDEVSKKQSYNCSVIIESKARQSTDLTDEKIRP